jgi:SAM-dependent methyltransferase
MSSCRAAWPSAKYDERFMLKTNDVKSSNPKHATRYSVNPRTFVKQSLVIPLAVAFSRGQPVRGAIRYVQVLEQFRQYRKLSGGRENVRLRDLFPWLLDAGAPSGKAGEYFYQDTWCVGLVTRRAPAIHVDVGSALISMGCLSQTVPLVYVDLRPTDVSLRNFRPLRGSLVHLPFADATIPSISSLSVVEHIGLGRYGDSLDASGTDRACTELSRILAPGGHLYVAVPTSNEPHVAFNAHRVFAPDDFIAKFRDLTLVDEAYGTATRLLTRDEYDKFGQPYAYGCYGFTRQDGERT